MMDKAQNINLCPNDNSLFFLQIQYFNRNLSSMVMYNNILS